MTALFQHDGMLSDNQEYFFCTVSPRNGKQMHYLVPVDGNQEGNNQPRVIQEANGRYTDKEGKDCAVCPSCLCSLQPELQSWLLMNSGAT